MTRADAGNLPRPRRRWSTRPRVEGVVRQVLAGTTANLAVGTLFAWSLVAEDAASDVGLSGDAGAAVFAPVAGGHIRQLQADHPGALGLVAAPLIPAAVALLLMTRSGPR